MIKTNIKNQANQFPKFSPYKKKTNQSQEN